MQEKYGEMPVAEMYKTFRTKKEVCEKCYAQKRNKLDTA
jgi:hypothetical protein